MPAHLALLSVLQAPRPRASHDLDKIPGPPSLPLLGNLLDIGNSKAHQTIATWAKRHGPIYKFKLAFTNHVVVSDPSEIGPLVARGEELPRPIDLIYQPFNQASTNRTHWKRKTRVELAVT